MSSEARELARRIVEDIAASHAATAPTAPAAATSDPATDEDHQVVDPEPAAPMSPARAAARRIVDEVFAAPPVPSTDASSPAAETLAEEPPPVPAAETLAEEPPPVLAAETLAEESPPVPGAGALAEDPLPVPAADEPSTEAPLAEGPATVPATTTGTPPDHVVVDVTDEAVLQTPADAEPSVGEVGSEAAVRPDPMAVAARIVEDVLAAQRAAADAPAARDAELAPTEVARGFEPDALPPDALPPAALPPDEADADGPSWLEVSDEPVEPAHEDGPPPVPPEALAGHRVAPAPDNPPEPGSEPAAASAPQPTPETTAESIPEPVPEPTAERPPEPAAERPAEPTADPDAQPIPEVRPLDEEPTVALEFEEPSRAGRWLLMTVIGALGLAVLFPLAVAAIRQVLSMS